MGIEVSEKELRQPARVVSLLNEYQDWRKGVGKYAWSEDPEKNAPMPFNGRNLTKVIDAAICHLESYCRIHEALTSERYA